MARRRAIRERRLDDAERNLRKSQAAARRERRAGLVKVPYSPRYYAQVSPGGTYLGVKATGVRQCIPPKSNRGVIRGFSRRSRSRMLKMFGAIHRTALSSSLLVTLTYPRSFPTESSTYRRHFHLFSERLRKTFPTSSAIWKLEFQTRGAPHFHLIVMGVPFLAREWLSRCWYQICDSGDIRHLRAGTQVQRSRSPREALAYVAKYVAKVTEGSPYAEPGRFWGVVGRGRLNRSLLTWPVDRRGYSRLARAIRHLGDSRRRVSTRRRYSASWIFAIGDRVQELVKWAAGLPTEPLLAR